MCSGIPRRSECPLTLSQDLSALVLTSGPVTEVINSDIYSVAISIACTAVLGRELFALKNNHASICIIVFQPCVLYSSIRMNLTSMDQQKVRLASCQLVMNDVL